MKKIAFPTQDGQTISAHIGGAPFFFVVTLGEENSLQSEQRSKPLHSQPAYDRAQSLGMEVLLVAESNITTALEAYRAGTLVSDLRRVHKHK